MIVVLHQSYIILLGTGPFHEKCNITSLALNSREILPLVFGPRLVFLFALQVLPVIAGLRLGFPRDVGHAVLLDLRVLVQHVRMKRVAEGATVLAGAVLVIFRRSTPPQAL